MFAPSSAEVRKFFCQAWAKRQANQVQTALEVMANDWIEEHPEYHQDLADEQGALSADYSVDAGRTNPFLHLSMHLSISEQLSIDQPPGIKAAYAKLSHHLNSAHAASHEVMECLGKTLWEAQRSGRAPDSQAYLECILRRASKA